VYSVGRPLGFGCFLGRAAAILFSFKTNTRRIDLKAIQEATMAIQYAQTSPIKEIAAKAKEIRKQAEQIETDLRHQLDEKRRRGRPISGKETVTLRVGAEVVARYKSLGEGWKDQMAADIEKASHLAPHLKR
jgi:uncharacterized protein (DUF4415 family)